MKIYLAGPMRGIPNFNFPEFDRWAEALRRMGYEVFSPADRDRKHYGPGIEENPTGSEAVATKAIGFSIREAMLTDCTYICNEADGIALMPGWEKSSGANAEHALAIALGIERIYLDGGWIA